MADVLLHTNILIAWSNIDHPDRTRHTITMRTVRRYVREMGFVSRKGVLVDKGRARIDSSVVAEFLQKYKELLNELQIQPHNLYNMDETGLLIGRPDAQDRPYAVRAMKAPSSSKFPMFLRFVQH